MRRQNDIDRRVAALAGRQHGVVTRDQLLALGLSPSAIDRRLRAGRLIRLHPGVYAVGHTAISFHARQLATVLACGPTAVLSHGSAAALWDLVGSQPSRIHVIVRTSAGITGPAGVHLHRYRSLADEDVTRRMAIPVTDVARTLLDLASVLPPRKLRRALAQADVLRLLDFAQVDRLVAAHPGRPGARVLATLVREQEPDPELSRSTLEELFLEFFDRHGFPPPRVNVEVEGVEADFHWPDRRVTVEADSFGYHRTRAAFERDRERDAQLAAAGWRVHRFTDRQVERQPELLVAALRTSLSDERR